MKHFVWWSVLLLGCLQPVGSLTAWQQIPDLGKIQAAGLQVARGRHLTLITDARDRPDVAEFTQVFDLAVSQWCEYFSIDPSQADTWHVVGCVMVDRERFARAGLFPADLPPFPAGFQRGTRLWLYVQPGDYYTRHLLLHEGTHAFMQQFLGGYGPPWYAEGMAELLGVHRWQEGRLEINHEITSRDEVPWWGRVKLVRTDRDVGKRLSLAEVQHMPAVSFRQVNAYGWAWAACEFFDRHPLTQAAFRQLPAAAGMDEESFTRHWRQLLSEQFENPDRELEFAWQNMVDEIDYGFDVASSLPVDTAADRTGNALTVSIATNRGWHRTAVPIQAGRKYEISGAGMYQVRLTDQPWPCDAGGVTIEYYRGRPLGQLVAAVEPEPGVARADSLRWFGVGRSDVLTFDVSGQLLLRINESPSAWSDNEGQLSVTIRPAPD